MDSMLPFLQTLEGLGAYSLLFVLLFGCGIGLPMNEDIVLLFASALTLKGTFDPVTLIMVAWVALVGGDGLVFFWGHKLGASALKHRLLGRIISQNRLEAMQSTMSRYGPAYIFVVRFMPGIRTPLFFAAGSLKMPYRHLFLFDGIGALIELPLLVYGVRYVGGRWDEILALIHKFQDIAFPTILVLLILIWIYQRHKSRTTSK